MLKILRIPRCCVGFFAPARHLFSKRQWPYFEDLVLAFAISFGRRNVVNLKRHLPLGPHRANYNRFLIEWRWKPRRTLQTLAKARLRQLRLQPGEQVYILIDDTKKGKRGKRMDAVGKFKDTVNGGYLQGHNYVCMLIVVRGQIIPFAIELYAKKEFCKTHPELTFYTQVQLATRMIHELPAFKGLEVCVLFDSFYCAKHLLRAVRDRGFTFVTTLKSNRNVYVRGHKKKAGQYARNVNRRDGATLVLNAHPRRTRYRVARRRVRLPYFGEVQFIASRVAKEKKVLPIISSHLDWSPKQILQAHRRRWSIELFFKETKQHLGLGEYQNLSYESAVKHLHLVCIACLLLTHMGSATCAQGKIQEDRLCVSPRITQLQAHLRSLVLRDMIEFIKKKVGKANALDDLEVFLSMDAVA